jgi:acetylornithine deacetylase
MRQVASTDETTRLLRDLVFLPSVNPMGRPLTGPTIFEHRVTDYLEAFFRDLGVSTERQPIAALRDNIIARFEPPGATRTILWEVHQDTVPTDGMTIDPFGAHIEDDRLFGRGACDVKGGMASMLAAFARLVREKPVGAATVIFAGSVDEEHTFLGVQKLAPSVRANFAVVAEPTRLQIVKAHKGVVRLHIHTTGRACHSSAPDLGVNAIYRMGRLLGAFERYADGLKTARVDPLLGRPTISVGRIEGGTSANTVPASCRVEIDRRLLPGEDGAAAARELTDFLRGQSGIDFPLECSQPWKALPPLGPENSGEAVDCLGRAVSEVVGHADVTVVPYGTDASTLAASGVPAVVFGPGDIAQAHTADEWVSLTEVAQAAEVLYRLALGK